MDFQVVIYLKISETDHNFFIQKKSKRDKRDTMKFYQKGGNWVYSGCIVGVKCDGNISPWNLINDSYYWLTDFFQLAIFM